MTDYSLILDTLKEVLDEGLENIVVLIEPAEIGSSTTAEVALYLTSEQSNESNLNTPTPYINVVNISVFCSEYSPDGVREAIRRRDALIGLVKTVLHANRTLNGTVDNTQFGDIAFDTSRGEGTFYAAANLNLKCFVTS